MPPKAEPTYDNDVKKPIDGSSFVPNSEIMPNAGKIFLDPPMGWGKGVVHDIRSTVGTHWISEVTNFNQKTVAVTFLMFISVIAPALAFGAVYGKVTESHIGAIETILATAWVGIAYSLIGGMPMCIIGSTGPVLAFTTVLYNISKNMDVPFYSFYVWVSVWLCIYAVTAGFVDLTRVVRLATRFTDDIFAFLIVSIFVMDAIGDPFSDVGILHFLDPNHKSHKDNYDAGEEDYSFLATGFLSVIIGLGTTWLIFYLRSYKHSSFFCSDGVRTSLHDFAVTLSVVTWTLVKELIFENIDTESLKVPDTFEPTFACCDASCKTSFPEDCPEQDIAFGKRSWFVSFSDFNGKGWVPIMAAGPAALAFVLVFLDNGITWHLIMRKGHKMEHGEAYNYDLCLSGFFNLVNGMLGLPWLVATTVPCMIHLNSLADKDKDGNFLKVQETRLTMLFSHALVALSLLFLNVLSLLPLPVLYGVFLFMGLSSLPGIQFWNRILLFIQQPSKYPATPYTKYMEKSRIHKYTLLQIFFFSLIFIVQNFKAIAIVFPLMTLLCIPGRMYLLASVFEGWELLLLDGEEEEIEEWIERKENGMVATPNNIDRSNSEEVGNSSEEVMANV